MPLKRTAGRHSKQSASSSITPSYPTLQSSSSYQGAYSRTSPQYTHSAVKKKAGRSKKIVIGAVCALLLCFVGVGVAAAAYLESINSALAGDRTDEEWDAINDVLSEASFDEPFYVLLVGSDARDGDTVSRSDTNIVVRVDATTGTITLISIPRDTAIELNGSIVKFNAAYNYGIESTISAANELLGIEISYFAEIHFDELVELVDAIGGVEVDVPQTINDSKAGSTVIYEGLQTLSGEEALTFARSRSYSDGDFTRTSNQRLLVEALINKILSLSLTELPSTIQQAAECVSTNFSVSDIIALATQFKNLDELTIYSAMVPSWICPNYINGQSFVITDEASLAEMMELVEAGEDPSVIEAASTITYPDFVQEYFNTHGTSSGADTNFTSSSYTHDDETSSLSASNSGATSSNSSSSSSSSSSENGSSSSSSDTSSSGSSDTGASGSMGSTDTGSSGSTDTGSSSTDTSDSASVDTLSSEGSG